MNRLITSSERDILLNSSIKSRFSLSIVFYITTIIIPSMTCFVVTLNMLYLYISMVNLIVLEFIMIIYPKLRKKYLINKEIYAFSSEILSCSRSNIYYYLVKIKNIDGKTIDYKYPVGCYVKKGTIIHVIMLKGINKYRAYYLIDTKNRLLINKRTRYDLIK